MIDYPTVPENIVIHLGAPNDSGVQNVTETFPDYIKNVASSEIYPTWPEEAIKANIYAQISVAMNRIYTGFYRVQGKDFDITSLPAFDQTYVQGRNVFENISQMVNQIFNSYIRRIGSVNPLFTAFCDGAEVTCPGLSQWGSVSLAEEGLNSLEILRYYYGDDIEIVSDVPVDSIPAFTDGTVIREGDQGRDVELIQRRLNRIGRNFPSIPKIVLTDGFYGPSTTDAVRVFQQIFNIDDDGIVGKATWYRIQYVWIGVKRLYEIESEGISFSEASTQYPKYLKRGEESSGVLILQYYLAYIGLFVETVIVPDQDGDFGEQTEASVRSFQKTYGLPVTGEVGRPCWNAIQSTYYSLVASLPFDYREGVILPYPGRVLFYGLSGDDVRAMQEYLNFIGKYYPDIPTVTVDGIFGRKTEEQVDAFRTYFRLPGSPGRMNAILWKDMTNIYEDLYQGRKVSAGQYGGTELGRDENA